MTNPLTIKFSMEIGEHTISRSYKVEDLQNFDGYAIINDMINSYLETESIWPTTYYSPHSLSGGY